ncbi:hypothetical protein PFISCL1PPCAC_23322, partial [Pristionchus fissidentatus]
IGITRNSSFCHDVILVVHSHARNVRERVRLRTILKKNPYFKMLFVLGTPAESSIEHFEEIKEEQRINYDLLVVNVVEHYHNITYKAQSWIRFLHETCTDVRWVVKMDDDVEVSPHLVEQILNRYRHYSNTLIGRVYINNRVVRHPESKWYLSPAEYSPDALGSYLQGMSYMLSGDLLPIMNANIDRVQYLWMDDWYVTHALLNGTTASLIDISPLIVSANSRKEVNELKKRTYNIMFLHLRPKEEFPPLIRRQIWTELQQDQIC